MKTVTAELGPCRGHGHLSMVYADLEDRSNDTMLVVSMTPRELVSFGFHAVRTAVAAWAQR